MQSAQYRVRFIGIVLTIIGAIAWANSLATFVVSSRLAINAEMVLLFAGLAVLRPDTRKTTHVFAIIFLAGIVVLLIPITAFTIAPTFNVSMFGEQFQPTSTIGLVFILTVTSAYIGTLAWLFALLKRDLRYETSAGK